MKSMISLFAGLALVLSLGTAFGADGAARTDDRGNKVFRDDDLLQLRLDPDRATLNQMPAEGGAEGSAAGGIRSDDSDQTDAEDIDVSTVPPDTQPAAPKTDGTGAVDAGSGPDTSRY